VGKVVFLVGQGGLYEQSPKTAPKSRGVNSFTDLLLVWSIRDVKFAILWPVTVQVSIGFAVHAACEGIGGDSTFWRGGAARTIRERESGLGLCAGAVSCHLFSSTLAILSNCPQHTFVRLLFSVSLLQLDWNIPVAQCRFRLCLESFAAL